MLQTQPSLILRLIQDFGRDCRIRRGQKPEHVEKVGRRLSEAAQACGWVEPQDLTANAAEAHLTARMQEGWSALTHNKVVSMFRCFGQWLERRGHVTRNPFAGLESVRATVGQGSRPFSGDELRAIFEAARVMEQGDNRRRAKRSVIYLTAALTGLRYSELRRLKWSDVVLAKPSRIELRPEGQKVARAGIRLPIAEELVVELSRWQAASGEQGRQVDRAGYVFPIMPSWRTVEADMARAGITKTDAQGRRLSFHGTRKFLATELRRQGADVSVRRRMLRHATDTLTTGTYDGVELSELAGEVHKLGQFVHNLGHGVKIHSRKVDSVPTSGNVPTQESPAPDGSDARVTVEPPPKPHGVCRLHDSEGEVIDLLIRALVHIRQLSK